MTTNTYNPPSPARTSTVDSPLVRIQNLNKTYVEGSRTHRVLDDVNLDIASGEFFVLLGKSGSGKSTLLNLIAAIDQPDPNPQTKICIDETDITGLDDTQQTLFRRNQVGIIFQFFNLIPTLTVLENITLPLDLQGRLDLRSRQRRQAQEKGKALLERVGLANRANTFPDKLSGGEQQRVAIARALITEPSLVLADEPTGNLDEDTGEQILDLLLELTRNSGKTLIMATHNPEILPMADHVYRIYEGKLVEHDSHVNSMTEFT